MDMSRCPGACWDADEIIRSPRSVNAAGNPVFGVDDGYANDATEGGTTTLKVAANIIELVWLLL
jgi:hypothetical protein